MKSEKQLEKGYREMAADVGRERDAAGWCDALIGGVAETADSRLARNDKHQDV